ncbi:hypothetical protein HG531_000365 [Fusarium graminearum]|nr:hypothetical protein HG531_000365 [Fusarium graminearum]
MAVFSPILSVMNPNTTLPNVNPSQNNVTVKPARNGLACRTRSMKVTIQPPRLTSAATYPRRKTATIQVIGFLRAIRVVARSPNDELDHYEARHDIEVSVPGEVAFCYHGRSYKRTNGTAKTVGTVKETQELVGTLHITDPSIVATVLDAIAEPSKKHDAWEYWEWRMKCNWNVSNKTTERPKDGNSSLA